ncbi:hypothetical protein COCMIDRAFT_27111 [Bipolaris oryzae ATCC 44560]|uniref:Uncharacterized protein n=1 Tax=Bipolaris oryzae ATCC 44560 TaxID=930090 RepID=W6Z3Q7_COCMI|nr:uncharacterized protein COCMIDRAFT_27111 [Bipolaris oryzae ATCC 44560]EUC44595.1 hypothetical protein COCMIDRAFT_27111 [Bipolaris oryzae ATCC 44560]
MLEKRVPVENPCPEGSTWDSRMCNANINERAYTDICKFDGEDLFIDIPGSCPEENVCMITGNMENDRFIFDAICVPKTPPSQDVITRRDARKRRVLAQYGRRFKKKGVRGGGAENIPVYIDHRAAFITAEFVSVDGDFIVTPSILNGYLKGTTPRVCKSAQYFEQGDRKHCLPADGPKPLSIGGNVSFLYDLDLRLDENTWLFYYMGCGLGKI